MSAPGGGGAPSPAPRSGSIGGANASMPPLPPQQPMAANAPVVHTPTTPGPSGPPPAPVSQQNLNQIVSSFLLCQAFSLYLCLLVACAGGLVWALSCWLEERMVVVYLLSAKDILRSSISLRRNLPRAIPTRSERLFKGGSRQHVRRSGTNPRDC